MAQSKGYRTTTILQDERAAWLAITVHARADLAYTEALRFKKDDPRSRGTVVWAVDASPFRMPVVYGRSYSIPMAVR